MSAAIALEGVWKYYGDYPALRDYSLLIAEGSCCALLGRNGAGKTTLLRVLAACHRFKKVTFSFSAQSRAVVKRAV